MNGIVNCVYVKYVNKLKALGCTRMSYATPGMASMLRKHCGFWEVLPCFEKPPERHEACGEENPKTCIGRQENRSINIYADPSNLHCKFPIMQAHYIWSWSWPWAKKVMQVTSAHYTCSCIFTWKLVPQNLGCAYSRWVKDCGDTVLQNCLFCMNNLPSEGIYFSW